MKYIITNIEWDTDGQEIDDLPERVEIEAPFHPSIEMDLQSSLNGEFLNEIGDYLSDEYDWCVYDFNIELVGIYDMDQDNY